MTPTIDLLPLAIERSAPTPNRVRARLGFQHDSSTPASSLSACRIGEAEYSAGSPYLGGPPGAKRAILAPFAVGAADHDNSSSVDAVGVVAFLAPARYVER
jgi:hypothetical protein